MNRVGKLGFQNVGGNDLLGFAKRLEELADGYYSDRSSDEKFADGAKEVVTGEDRSKVIVEAVEVEVKLENIDHDSELCKI